MSRDVKSFRHALRSVDEKQMAGVVSAQICLGSGDRSPGVDYQVNGSMLAAVELGNDTTTQLFLESGADPNIVGGDDRTRSEGVV